MTKIRRDTETQWADSALPPVADSSQPNQLALSSVTQKMEEMPSRYPIQLSADGFLTEMWAINDEKVQVFPHLKSKRGESTKGLEITLTGKKEDYHLVDLDNFLSHVAKGHFEKIGRVRMKPRGGGQSNGFAVRKTMMSQALLINIEERRER